MEYDRDGYRYDGSSTAGANPNRIGEDAQSGVPVVDSNGKVLGTNPDGIRYGDYWAYDPLVGLVDKFSATDNGLADTWEDNGSAEVDCLWCHYAGYYNYQARNYCISELGGNKALEYGPTFGLVGTDASGEDVIAFMKYDQTGEAGSVGAPNAGNPSCEITGYSLLFSEDFIGYRGVLPLGYIEASPDITDCALCHKADASWLDKGPADVPLGYTSFQKYIPADPNPAGTDCTTDSDCIYADIVTQYGYYDRCDDDLTPCLAVADCEAVGATTCIDNDLGGILFDPAVNPGFCDSDTGKCNAQPYYITKGRAEFGKRAESINDPLNPEVHMDNGFLCVDCHYLIGKEKNVAVDKYKYNLAEEFGPILDDQGRQVQPKTFVIGMDHQFAKGNNNPDGKNMDQLDNTVTCRKCHIDQLHENITVEGGIAYLDMSQDCAPGEVDCAVYDVNPARKDLDRIVPFPTHPAFPAFHFERIDCRTCHIYEQNFVKKETVTDYTSTTFPTTSSGGNGGAVRSQSLEDVNGIHYKPLRIWGCREHDCGPGEMFIQPATSMVNVIWKDLTDNLPYARRTATEATKILQQVMRTTGPWTVNSAQGGDKALIINTTDEISNMVSILQGNAVDGFGPLNVDAQLADPVIDLMLTTFTTSHNRSNERPLGGKGCAECHASSDPAHPKYNPLAKDIGFFDKQFELFKQPVEGGGLQMTCDNNDCSDPGNTKRIEARFKFPCNTGPVGKVEIDLTENVDHGQPIKNSLDQGEVFCFDPVYLERLKTNFSSAYFADLTAEFSWFHDPAVSQNVHFTSGSTCPEGQACTITWDFGDTTTGSGNYFNHTYVSAGSYEVTLTLEDEHGYTSTKTRTVSANDLTPRTVTASAVDNGNGTATVTVNAGPYSLKEFYVQWGDTTPTEYFTAYYLLSKAVTHTFVGVPSTYDIGVYVIDVKNNAELIWLNGTSVTGP